jgi:hypothetical protein
VAEHPNIDRFGIALVDVSFSLRLDFGDAAFEVSPLNSF